jgi:hypothetical protein
MPNRGGPLAVGLKPIARAPVQVRHLVRLFGPQVRLQNLREQMVIPIPAAAVVEWNHEQVPSLQRLQHGFPRPRILAGNGVAERGAQPVQDGGV